MLNTLPGDIPGLLRHCSPVLWADEPCLVQCSRDGAYRRVDGDVGGTPDAAALRLDLTDPTGRAQAAVYAYHHPATQGFTGLMHDEHAAMESALHFDDMTPTEIDTLAHLVLRLAGRTP